METAAVAEAEATQRGGGGGGGAGEEVAMVKSFADLEKEAIAIAESFTSLFSSLRSDLSEVTGASVEHMRCFNDAAGRVQEAALDAATKGNHFINSCLRKALRRNVDTLDSTISKILDLP
ncbi:uncharacterized protein LOC116266448 isoform X2 [Nymphaea colorata]|uniref:uncharacterized protein LOC116266448 isoform X2 n=1 Tax=Nymphaea colorata TaxID=210225 RepID=UPI00129E3223|nr:uncharacterized protein LOC116266448 isoform X2 [Nymphaea colorata]